MTQTHHLLEYIWVHLTKFPLTHLPEFGEASQCKLVAQAKWLLFKSLYSTFDSEAAFSANTASFFPEKVLL